MVTELCEFIPVLVLNRARLKKECDDFKKHPEYDNFIREQMDTMNTGEVVCKDGLLSTETARELEDGEVKMDRAVKEATGEANFNRTLANAKTE